MNWYAERTRPVSPATALALPSRSSPPWLRGGFYFRNASPFVLPLLTIYFVWKRGSGVASGLWLALPFAAGAVFANVFPFRWRGLAAIAARISEFGFTPNRVAALGENLILFVNLAWTAWLYARFIRHKRSFAVLERWRIAYLPVYSVWAALVVVMFPPVFGYR
jgi:hypothetical protein